MHELVTEALILIPALSRFDARVGLRGEYTSWTVTRHRLRPPQPWEASMSVKVQLLSNFM